MFTKNFRKVISIILTLGLLVPTIMIPASAVELKTETVSEASDSPKDVSPYDYTEPQYENTDYMSEQQYKDLGFSSLTDPDEFSESDQSNPLDGYETSILSELYMGRGGYSKDYSADARIFENAETYGDLSIDSLNKNILASNGSYINDANNGKKWQYQSSVTEAVKLGDLSSKEFIPDSVIQNSMYIMGNDSWQSLVLYKYNEENHSLDYECQADWKIQSGDKFVEDIEVQESGGYQAIAVGDFNGVNYNEIAVYRSNAGDPQIAIYEQSEKDGKISLNCVTSNTIHLKDIDSHFSTTKSTNRPLVNLSTTNISGKDDLVINITLPYSNDDSFKYDGCTAIYSWNNGVPTPVFKDSGAYGDYRMKFTSSVAMDIDGNGIDELVIAGNKNYNYKNGDSRGDMSKNENLVNVILWDGKYYYKAWSEPMVVSALDWVKKDKDRKEPVAVTGTRFDSTNQKETLFVEGVFYSFVSGNGETANEQIVNGKFVTSKMFSHGTGDNNNFFHLAKSASFVEDDRLSEQALVIYGDEKSSDTDKIYLDIYWCYGDGTNITIKCFNDNYFNSKDEDDNGTFLTFCPLDVDNDSTYMQYTNKTVGWSNPQVHSVMLSVPYWSELDYGSAMTARGSTGYSIKTGTGSTESSSENFTLGGSFSMTTGCSVFGSGGKFGFNFDASVSYLHSYQNTHTYDETLTFTAGAGEDYVAVLIVPIVTYHYKTWIPKHIATQDEVDAYLEAYGKEGCPNVGDTVEGYFTDMCVNVQLNPANSTIPLNTYNRVIENFNQTEDEKYRLPTIDLNEIYPGRDKGDPSSYAENINEIYSLNPEAKSTLVGTNDTSVGLNGKSTVSQALSVGTSESSSDGYGFNLKLGASQTGELGMDILGILDAKTTFTFSENISGGASFTWASANSNNITYTNTYASLPDSAQTGVENGVPTSAYAFSSKLVKWEPKCISTSTTITTVDGENLTTKTSVIGSIVSGADGAPPALPSNFHVSSTTSNTSTLRWSNSSNYTRKPIAYKLYYSKSASGDYLPVKDDGKEVVIDGNSEIYTVKGLSEKSTYYFKLRAFYNADNNSTASVLGPYASGTTKGNSAEPKITKPPEDLYRTIGHSAEFSISAVPSNENNTLSYKWQQLVQTDYLAEWRDIVGDEAKKSTFNAAYIADDGLINESNAKTLDNTIYRCIVTEQNHDGNDYCSTISRSAVLNIENHIYDKNGFCEDCGNYQPAVLNSDGVYEISNAGQLFWFASLVNGDNTHAEFNQQDKSANGYLKNDIDLEGREWTSIKDYSGDFSGNKNCPTISGFNIAKEGENLGLFESVSGTISDFKLEGSITSTSPQAYWFVGGIAGECNGAEITNVISDVDINCQVAGSAGGLVGIIQNSGKIQNCMYSGTMNVSISMFGVGGIAGCSDLYGSSDNIISNCANLGNISADSSSISTGGIIGFMMYKAHVGNCYNYGNISVCNRNDVEHCGALIGLVVPYSKIENNYYREGSAANAFGNEVEFESKVIPKTADEFASGEVAYLLNSEVTDGTQVWYQNIDNGKTPDDYPKFDGGTVYKTTNCSGTSTYSNNKSGGKADHEFDENGFCKVCGAYQPAVLNSNGVYEISNTGQFFWFASLVNGDKTYAEFDSQNSAANAVLVNDIDFESREWVPIGNNSNAYSGVFDGGNYSIKNINGMLFGSVSGGTLKNICIDSGLFKGNSDYAAHTGSIVGTMYNSTITHSYSKAKSGDIVGDLGGIAGKAFGTITDCYFAGTLNGKGTTGGLAGSSWNVNESLNIKNCYVSANSISGNSNTGAFVGWLHGNSTVDNSFYNSTAYSENPFGTSQNESYTNEDVKALSAKSCDEFKSGKVTYLLNSEVTDGTQVWYQNIDNGETPDDYPNFDGGTVYYLSYKEAYSNTYSEPSAEPDAFDKDDDGNLIIKTYDDLVKLSQLIISDYEVYGSQNYILTKNIKATENSEWTQGIGSVADNKPFNGTFDGNGYCIIGLNVNSAEYGGLFEIIGEKGCVKDLFVFDCDFKSSANVAGGIASINNGTIDHCISGVNLTTGTIHINSNKSIDAVALNSAVKGEISGGIAGENNGLITGCRNAAVVTGTQCGGIAGDNTGKIYGCANSVKIGTSTSSVSGGLAGKNIGTIESSYNSGTVNADSEKALGSIAGINGYKGAENQTVKNVFYSTVNNLKAVGTDSLSTPDDTNKAKTKNSDFQNDTFVNDLNAVSDDTVVWVRNPSFNKGNPTIKGNFFKYSVKSSGNNITVEGSMHEALNIQYNACTNKDEVFGTITSALGNTKALNVYSVSLTDNDGNYIPAELWCQGNFKITVPVNSKNVEFAGLDTDGKIIYYKPDTVENGAAVFTVSHPMSFAVVDSTTKNVSVDNGNSAIKTTNDNTPIQTGTTMLSAVLLIAMFSIVLIFCAKRRNKIG